MEEEEPWTLDWLLIISLAQSIITGCMQWVAAMTGSLLYVPHAELVNKACSDWSIILFADGQNIPGKQPWLLST